MTHLVEIHQDYVVNSDGDVRSPEDYLDAEGNVIDIPDPRVVEQAPVVEVTPVVSTELLKTGPLESRVDNWLDLNRPYNDTLTEADACRALGINPGALRAEKDAILAAWREYQSGATHFATSAIARAGRSRHSN